ncbi:uncharacterized protein SPSK_07285 [Sporothrix schenckii 1099-18]|uniref:Uncharacterized protein n=2 Tax=Sporothrix schenckii TaxID=29908 RepID=U7Q2A5_SPOS1|nr:uncharacterized protein SPSK_07285 [Sporothrix schenckii 1099-18]ERT01140.1 hypothetical protein HMPREF1624_02380 [Sporothrix schenckii ATCC 58251]KJR88274.1 hypothetical protein SPSK_07285 [Sporothrix schenckii 1099-18]
MFFSKYVPVLGALVAGVQASPAPITPVGNSLVSRSPSKTSFDLSKSYNQATLFSGLAPAAENGLANVNLHLGLPNAHITGNVDVELNANFILEPTVIINLGGVEAYIELDVKADAKVFEAAELVTSGKLSIDIPGLLDVEAGLALALDLVICLDAAIDLSAGFYVNFPQGSFIEVNVLTSKVVRHQLDNLNARTLPLTLGVDVDLNVDVELEVGLRLRTELGIDANVDPLGIPLLSAGAEVAVWINLFDYTSVIIGHPSHPRPPSCPNNAVTEAFALDVGIIVALDVDVLDIVNLDLAPTISVTLASAPIATSCIPPCAGCQHSASSSAATSTVTASSVPASSAGASTVTHISSGATTVTSTDNAASSSYTKTVVSHSGSTVTKTLSSGSGASSTGSAGPISSATVRGPQSLTTSTYFETTTVTITSCAASVVNCPASYTQKVVTEIVVAKTTVCPVAAASSAAHWRGNATVSTAAATTTHGPVVVTVPAKCSNTVTFSTIPASSATSNTFTAPTSVSVVGTVTLTGAKQATVTPTAIAAPTIASTGGSQLITAQPSASKPGYTSPSNLPVTAAAAGVSATHAGGLLALVAGMLLAL